jgi:hypothetical protein
LQKNLKSGGQGIKEIWRCRIIKKIGFRYVFSLQKQSFWQIVKNYKIAYKASKLNITGSIGNTALYDRIELIFYNYIYHQKL